MATVLSLGLVVPAMSSTSWVAPGAVVVGAVRLAAHSSVWYAAVLRGDGDQISIGAGSNVQDGAVVHTDPGFPVQVGSHVSVGHRALLHGCAIDDDCLIGMGAVLMNGVELGAGSLVAAGSVVAERTVVPPRSLLAGVPARVRRSLDDEEVAGIVANARRYIDGAEQHRSSTRIL